MNGQTPSRETIPVWVRCEIYDNNTYYVGQLNEKDEPKYFGDKIVVFRHSFETGDSQNTFDKESYLNKCHLSLDTMQFVSSPKKLTNKKIWLHNAFIVVPVFDLQDGRKYAPYFHDTISDGLRGIHRNVQHTAAVIDHDDSRRFFFIIQVVEEHVLHVTPLVQSDGKQIKIYKLDEQNNEKKIDGIKCTYNYNSGTLRFDKDNKLHDFQKRHRNKNGKPIIVSIPSDHIDSLRIEKDLTAVYNNDVPMSKSTRMALGAAGTLGLAALAYTNKDKIKQAVTDAKQRTRVKSPQVISKKTSMSDQFDKLNKLVQSRLASPKKTSLLSAKKTWL